ncbi:MAG: hypothetical protein KIT31_13495 [Deltaproteobacteria bacterium]|nr:hypothetical protein [Deltaproteobacteria bacterium]
MMRTTLIAMCWAVLVAACGGAKPTSPGNQGGKGGDTVAVALVMNGWEVWVGNDRILEASDPARYEGALDYVKAGVDGAQLGALPAGSQGTLIVYADKATVKLPMGPIAKLNGEAIGGQKEYMETTGSELVQGVELGLAELRKTSAKRKLLLVVGDGNDTNRETAKPRLADLRKQAEAEQVELRAVIYKTALSTADSVISGLVPDAAVARTVDDVKTQIGLALEKLRR